MKLIEEIAERTIFITEHVAAMVEARKVANTIESEREKAIAYHDTIAPMLEEIRYHIDKLELIVDNQMWTLPKYLSLIHIFLSALAIAVPAMGMAQDKVEASVGADFVSGYIWRGQDLGGVSIQPTLSVSYKGFSLSAWGTALFHTGRPNIPLRCRYIQRSFFPCRPTVRRIFLRKIHSREPYI